MPYCMFVDENSSKKFKVVKRHFGAVYVLAEPSYCLLPEWTSPLAQICAEICAISIKQLLRLRR